MNVRLALGPWSRLQVEAGAIRREVFVLEQGIPESLEWDAADADCLHCVAYEGERAVGTGRLLPDAHIGRMAVLPHARRLGVGGMILQALVDAARARGEREVMLSAQRYVQAFYERHGFIAEGEPYMDAGIEHVAMRRPLAPDAVG